jgi:transcription initiation factor TFIIIB Brf1 subunit/transcription initiation factor TFIIB
MLASFKDRCSECAGEVVDVGDEFVCKNCGVVASKEVVETRREASGTAADYTGQSLGGYLGPLESGPRERFSRGLTSSQSTFGYLKLVSDFAGREESTLYCCVKLVERVCEKLGVPKVVAGQAMIIARRLYHSEEGAVCVNSAAVSAYAIITACKIAHVTAVSVREVIAAHRLLGRRVRFASIVRLSFDSPYRGDARRAEDYVSRVIAQLSSSRELATVLRDLGVGASSYLTRLRQAAMASLSVLEDSRRGGHNPIALAATAVYAGEALLCTVEGREMLLTQKGLASLVGVAEYTVREQYGELFRPLLAEAVKGTTLTAALRN